MFIQKMIFLSSLLFPHSRRFVIGVLLVRAKKKNRSFFQNKTQVTNLPQRGFCQLVCSQFLFVAKLPNFISISQSFQFQKEVDLNNTRSQNFYSQTYCTNGDNFVCLFDILYLISSRNHY